MASFTESATLILRDKSTANINKINAALKRLFATSQKMRKMNLGLDTRKLSQAQTKIKAITRDISNLQRRRINIQANTAQLTRAQTQLARLRAQAARPIVQAIRTTTTAGGAGGRGVGGTGGGGRGRGVGGGPELSVAFGVKLHALTTAIHGLTRAIVAGGRQQDIADTMINQFAIPAAQKQEFDDASERLAGREGAVLNQAQFKKLLAETAPSMLTPEGKFDVPKSERIVGQVEGLIKQQVRLTGNLEASVDSAFNLVKAVSAAGKTTEAEQVEWLRALGAAKPLLGPDVTDADIRQFMRNAPTLRQTMDIPATIKTLFLAEEDRSKISTGLEAIRKNLTAGTIKQSQMELLDKLGLIDTREGPKGNLIFEGAKGTEEFLKDPYAYVEKNFINREAELEKIMRETMAPHEFKNRFGEKFSLQETGDIASLSQAIFSNPNAQQMLATIINQTPLLAAQMQAYNAQLALGEDAQAQLNKDSLLIAKARLQASFESVSGQAVRTIEPYLTPIMDKVSGVLTDVAAGNMPNVADLAIAAGGMAATSALMVPFAQMTGMSALATGAGNQTQLLGAIATSTAQTAANTGGNGIFGGIARLLGPTALAALGVVGGAGLIYSQRDNPNLQYKPGANPFADWIMDNFKKAHGQPTLAEDREQALKDFDAKQAAAIQGRKEDKAARERGMKSGTWTPEQEKAFLQMGKNVGVNDPKEVWKQVQAAAEKDALATYGVGGKEGIAKLQAEVGAFVDGIFGPQTYDMYRKKILERQEKLADIKDESAPYRPPVPYEPPKLTDAQLTALQAMEDRTKRKEESGGIRDVMMGNAPITTPTITAGSIAVGSFDGQVPAAGTPLSNEPNAARFGHLPGEPNPLRFGDPLIIPSITAGSININSLPQGSALMGGGGQNTMLGGATEGTGMIDNMVGMITLSMNQGGNIISTAFSSGATKVSSAGTSAAASISSGMTTGGSSAGQTIASAMIGAASTVGNTIAAAVRNGVAGLSIPVSGGGAAPDPGAMAVV